MSQCGGTKEGFEVMTRGCKLVDIMNFREN